MILHHVEYGMGGTPLVFLGSLGSDTNMWLPQLDYFSATRRTVAIDHPGHGGSAAFEGEATVGAFAASVQETLHKLGIKHYDVVGLSLGGAVAQWLARHDSNVRHTVLICTAPKFGESASWVERADTVRSRGVTAISDAVVDRWFSPGWLSAHPASRVHFRSMIEATSSNGYATACDALATWDFHSELKLIDCPTLVIAGTEDPSTSPAVVRQIADGIPAAQFEELSPAAHLPNLEQPDAVNQLIGKFLTQ